MKKTLACILAAMLAAQAAADLAVLHCGSDWCVSGDEARLSFEKARFGDGWEAKELDDMDEPPAAVKAANDALRKLVPEATRYPALTCMTSGRPGRFYARFDNLPRDITPQDLQKMVQGAEKAKDEAVAMFDLAERLEKAGCKLEAADAYGSAFELLEEQCGRDAGFLRKGAFAWKKEWEALAALDKGDRYGWVMRFTAGTGIGFVEKASAFRKKGDFKSGEAFVKSLREVPQGRLLTLQRQAIDIAEYALWRDSGEAARKAANRKLLENVYSMGRKTLWGECAAGLMKLDGEKIAVLARYRAPLRERTGEACAGLARFAQSKAGADGASPWTEEGKLAIVRADIIAKIGRDAIKALESRKGSAEFAEAFFNNREWMEDFAWSGPARWPEAILALEAICWHDDGRWAARDAAGRRCATAMALECARRDEAFLADFYDAYRQTWLEGRLHKKALAQNTWLWRFAMAQAHEQCHSDDPATQHRFVEKFANMPIARYGKAHWFIPYRSYNCFGDSVHSDDYYKPWKAAGDWALRLYTPDVGGVCGELSKFGTICSNVHGLPATTAGQPRHCAYTRRTAPGVWRIENNITGPTDVHLTLWGDNAWTMLQACEDTFEGEREKRLDAARYAALAAAAERAGALADEIERLYAKALAAWPKHYGVQKEYVEWAVRARRPLGEMRAHAVECAGTLHDWRKPLWNLLTPYFKRVADEKGSDALADELAAFAPLLRQSAVKVAEEADFRKMLGQWAEPLRGDAAALAKTMKAALAAQHGTEDYFSQVLGWGCDTMMKDDALFAMFSAILDELGREKGALDFKVLILGAERSRNLKAFQRLAALNDTFNPPRQKGERCPESDFGGTLLSSGGMIYGSSTCERDTPAKHLRCIDSSPRDGTAISTDYEGYPELTVTLAGAAEVTGVAIASGASGREDASLAPLEVQVSEDGKDWRTVYADDVEKAAYRIDLSAEAPRALHVRARRKPGAIHHYFPVEKFLVYGRKLY